MMTEKKAPHNPMTKKNNGLSSAQEVLYNDEFKRADNIVKNEENTNHRPKNK